MRAKRVTSRQVAKLAGVSQTTVSFVLNNVDGMNISEETRERVLQAARELNYVPDVAARNLARGSSANMGLVLVQPHREIFIDEYVPQVLTGISEATRKNGYRILVELVEDSSHPSAYIDLIRGKEIAGMIVNLNNPAEEDVQKLVHYVRDGFPIVMLDTWHESLYSVTVDKMAGVRQVVQHLIDLGHERIACIPYAPPLDNYHANHRLVTYKETLEASGLTYDESLVRHGEYDPSTGYAAMKSLLQDGPHPTAVYAMNDVMALGAITAIQDAGLRVPQDIAVVGFDDIRLARFTTPALTTVYEPDIEHGRQAANMLFRLIREEPIEEGQIVLDTRLVIRDSCGYRLQHGEENPPSPDVFRETQ